MKIDSKKICKSLECQAKLSIFGRYCYTDHSVKCTKCGRVEMLPLPGFNPLKARQETMQA